MTLIVKKFTLIDIFCSTFTLKLVEKYTEINFKLLILFNCFNYVFQF